MSYFSREKIICSNKLNRTAALCSERHVQIKSKKDFTPAELSCYHDVNFNFVLVMLMFSYVVYLTFWQLHKSAKQILRRRCKYLDLCIPRRALRHQPKLQKFFSDHLNLKGKTYIEGQNFRGLRVPSQTSFRYVIYLILGVTETWREANFTLMSAETLISGGVSVMDGHCWGPSHMLIQDLANSPRAHSFWMEHLDRGDIYHIKFRGNQRQWNWWHMLQNIYVSVERCSVVGFWNRESQSVFAQRSWAHRFKANVLP